MMRNRLYTEEQVHQVVDEVLRRLDSTVALQEPEHLDNSIPQQSSPGTKMTLSVREAAELIGISRPTMYQLIRENQIPSIHRPGLYTRLILSGKLYEHLAEIDDCCSNRKDRMIRQMADTEGVDEGLKARNQLMWVGCMNNIQQRAEETLLHELIYV